MIVRCVAETAKDFSPILFSIGLTPFSEFNLEIGKSYTVYSVNVWRGMVSYLLIGERRAEPSWYPSEAFEVVDNTLPSRWYFGTYKPEEKNGLQLIVGYDEMVNTIDSHYDELIECESQAVEVFNKRRREIDQES